MSELLTFKRFVELESRVRKIEKHLRLSEQALPEPEPPAIPMAEVVTESAPETEAVLPPPLPIAVVAPPVPLVPEEHDELSVGERLIVAREQADSDEGKPWSAPTAVAYERVATPAPRKDSHSSVEQWIGLNWTGWIGAIVLVICAALGIKYAYDQGWLGGLPREVRLAMCFSAGLGLLGLGEWIDRKINRISAACVFGAGIATLFVVSYAGFGYFELYSQATAFVLMAISTVIGSLVAMRKNLVVIAVLALLGGNLAPIILRTHEPRFAALLAYILALQVVALLLTALGRGGKWWVMRVFGIAMPALWVAAVYGQSTLTLLPIRFSIAYALLAQAELIVSTGRRKRIGPGQAAPASLLVTALLAFSLLTGFQQDTAIAQGMSLLFTAGVTGAAAFALAKVRGELSLSFRIQSALLLLVAVPVMLHGLAILLAFAGLSLAFAVVGSKLQSPWGRWLGTAAWVGAVLYLGQWAVNEPGAREIVWIGQPMYLFMAMLVTAVGHALSSIVLRQDKTPVIDLLVSAIDGMAGVVLVVASIVALPQWYATGAIAAYGWALFIAGGWFKRPSWTIHAGAALVLAVAKWGAVDLIGARLAPTYEASKYLPVVNPVMGVGTLLAGSIVAIYAMRRDEIDQWLMRHRAGSPVVRVMTLLVLMMTFALSMEIDRTVSQLHRLGMTQWPYVQLELLGLSMLWSLMLLLHSGLLLKLAGEPAERHTLLTRNHRMMLVLAIKFLLVDTLAWYLADGSARVVPILNFQMLAGEMIAIGLGVQERIINRQGASSSIGRAMILAILLLVGTIEIDRAVERTAFAMSFFDNARLAKQVAISIYWSAFAVGAIILGFRLRIAGLRYFGLGLLAVALCKVVLVDLSEVGRGYRILSFLVLGGLMLATSVTYGKLSPKLLETEAEQA